MIITEAQKFIYGLLALTFITILVLVLLNVYALDVFLLLVIVEFLVLVELTKPPLLGIAWRKNITVFVVICVIVLAIFVYQRISILR